MYLAYISKKRDVEKFLDELHAFINREDFDIAKDFFLNIAGDSKRERSFSIEYTMYKLGYDNVDIVEILKTLCVKEYSETKIDKDNTHPPLLFVFGKVIDGKEVYIKIKLRERAKRDIACISFHFAKNKMEYPYR